MTYAAAITAIKTAVETVTVGSIALHYAGDPRISDLAVSSRPRFDGSYLIRNDGGGSIYPELQSNPAIFTAFLTLQIGTALTTDALTQDDTAEQRGQKTIETLLTSDLSNVIDLQAIGDPAKNRAPDDRRIVWAQRFRLIYKE